MNKEFIVNSLNAMIPEAKTELNYSNDYELLIAVMLSANSRDVVVNQITKELFKYDLEGINKLSVEEIKKIIRSVGSYKKKSLYIKDITERLINEQGGKVPNDREFLESLKGVGRKTTNVIISNLFNKGYYAVDTHVKRVSNILFITNSTNELQIEKDLNKFFKDEDVLKINNQLILFGRYICTARNPKCSECLFNKLCKKTLE